MKNVIVRCMRVSFFSRDIGPPSGNESGHKPSRIDLPGSRVGRATAQTVTTLYTFSGGYDGGAVGGALRSAVRSSTARPKGGAYGQGDVFSMPVTGGSVTVLSSLSGALSGFTLGPGSLTLVGSTLYGMTYGGGANYDGSVFQRPCDWRRCDNLAFVHGHGGACPGAGPNGSLTLYRLDILRHDATTAALTGTATCSASTSTAAGTRTCWISTAQAARIPTGA